MTFTPNWESVGSLKTTPTIADLAAEVGFYSATPEFIRAHGGPIAREFLDQVPAWFYTECQRLGLYPNADARIHRLYPGDFPAYPGWHCDGEFRETYFAQPDLEKIPLSWHIIAHTSWPPGISCTEILNETIDVGPVPDLDLRDEGNQRTLWGHVHACVQSQPRRTVTVPDGDLILMDARTVHRCRPTTVRGWRMFLRMSMWHKPNLGRGHISRQEQVYKLVEGSGW